MVFILLTLILRIAFKPINILPFLIISIIYPSSPKARVLFMRTRYSNGKHALLFVVHLAYILLIYLYVYYMFVCVALFHQSLQGPITKVTHRPLYGNCKHNPCHLHK